jgi:esterase/lipase
VHELKLEEGRSLAYKYQPGDKDPTIVMVPGLHPYTHMDGDKAHCLLRYCHMNSYSCLVYDHECMGQSKGDMKKVMFSHWVEDVTAVIETLTEGPVVLCGTSLGGWLALIAAQEITNLHGLILFSPAVNYVYKHYVRHMDTLPKQLRDRLEAGSPHMLEHELGNALLKKDFAEDSRRFEINLEEEINIKCPVRIINSLSDNEIGSEDVIKLTRALQSDDVDLTYRKNSDHQLDNPCDHELFLITLDRMLKDNPTKRSHLATTVNPPSITISPNYI